MYFDASKQKLKRGDYAQTKSGNTVKLLRKSGQTWKTSQGEFSADELRPFRRLF